MFQWSQPYYATDPVWEGQHFGNTGVCLGITIPRGRVGRYLRVGHNKI